MCPSFGKTFYPISYWPSCSLSMLLTSNLLTLSLPAPFSIILIISSHCMTFLAHHFLYSPYFLPFSLIIIFFFNTQVSICVNVGFCLLPPFLCSGSLYWVLFFASSFLLGYSDLQCDQNEFRKSASRFVLSTRLN